MMTSTPVTTCILVHRRASNAQMLLRVWLTRQGRQDKDRLQLTNLAIIKQASTSTSVLTVQY